VSDVTAIRNGSLMGKSQFFGANLSEVISRNALLGNWNNNQIYSVVLTDPWFMFGGRSGFPESGLFTHSRRTGEDMAEGFISHRTILLGY